MSILYWGNMNSQILLLGGEGRSEDWSKDPWGKLAFDFLVLFLNMYLKPNKGARMYNRRRWWEDVLCFYGFKKMNPVLY